MRVYGTRAVLAELAMCMLAAVSACGGGSGTPEAQAFDKYESVRALLSDDQFENVNQHATELAPLAEQVAGEDAKAAVLRMASAPTINDARIEFIEVSALLVPKFREAKLPDVHGFQCPLKNGTIATWAQRPETIQNPYFGKSWIDCGEALPASE